MLTEQLDYKAAALTFSGNKKLTINDIGKLVFNNALKKTSRNINPTDSWINGKLGNLFPSIGFWLTETLMKEGWRKQAEYKKLICLCDSV